MVKPSFLLKMLARSGMSRKGMLQRFETFRIYKKGGKSAVPYMHMNEWVGTGYEPDGTKRGVLLYGPTGVGKTHLACAAANELIRGQGVFVMFLPTVRIPRNDTDELLRLTDPDEVPVLVLDDLGAERLTGRALECLYILIDGRLQAGAPMVVTTNYAPDDLRRRLEGEEGGYGDRLLGRLHEACLFIPMGGKDARSEM